VRENGRLLVPIALNGKEGYTFLFDTGATTTVVNEPVATKAGLTGKGSASVLTFGGTVSVVVATLDRLLIGCRRIEGQEVLIGNLGRLFGLDGDIDGILGQDVLSRFNYVLDQQSRKLEIEENGKLAASVTGNRLPFERRAGKIYVPVAKGTVRLILDSGNPYLVLYEDVSRNLNPVRGGSKVLSSFSRRREVLTARIPILELGDRLLVNAEVLLAERQPGRYEDGFLPLHFFDSIYVNNLESFLIVNPKRKR